MSNKVMVVKDRGDIMVLTEDRQLARDLRNQLCYTKFILVRGYDNIRENGGSKHKFERVECYQPLAQDPYVGLVAPAGFLTKLATYCKEQGVKVLIKDISKEKENKNRYVIDRSILESYKFRGDQLAVIDKVLKRERCRVQWPTGAGKSFLISILCKLLYKSNILVTVKGVVNAIDIHDALLARGIHDAGLYCSTKKVPLGRVDVISTGSLHNADQSKYDIIMADEIHELATPNYLELLSLFSHCRAFGFSANISDRQDNADFEMEGMFGPIVHRATYQEAVDKNMVSRVKVRFFSSNIRAEDDPSRGCREFEFDKFAIWTNRLRNKRIAQVLSRFEQHQSLVPVRTLEHAVHLKREMPDAEIVYSPTPSNAQKIKEYIRQGLLPKDTKPLTRASAEALKKKFEKGIVKKVVATTVWDKGVNFPRLKILFMADPSSKISMTQRAGRLSRLFEGKKNAYVLQLKDEFNVALQGRVRSSRQFYASQKWEQKDVIRKKKKRG
jgi:superfamily II DNA or RNA helicase